MTLAFSQFIGPELLLLLFSSLLLIIPVGYYGKNTVLGFGGSVLLAIISSPFVAFIVIAIIRARERNKKAA